MTGPKPDYINDRFTREQRRGPVLRCIIIGALTFAAYAGVTYLLEVTL